MSTMTMSRTNGMTPAEAVYIEARAKQLRGVDLQEAVAVYARRSEDIGAPAWTLADVTPPARFRLYRATASAMFVLDHDSRRIEVSLDALGERT